jgi:hypothetical protein
MKKLLVLALVLGLTSAANATLSIEVDGEAPGTSITVAQGATVTVSILSDSTANYVSYIILDNTSAVVGGLGSPHTYKGTDAAGDGGNAGESGKTSPLSSPSWGVGYLAQALSIAGQVVAGTHHTFVYTAPMSDGTATLGLFDAGVGSSWGDEVANLQIIVPEPMTIALLGLGGLFLRRRK